MLTTVLTPIHIFIIVLSCVVILILALVLFLNFTIIVPKDKIYIIKSLDGTIFKLEKGIHKKNPFKYQVAKSFSTKQILLKFQVHKLLVEITYTIDDFLKYYEKPFDEYIKNELSNKVMTKKMLEDFLLQAINDFSINPIELKIEDTNSD